ncbi:MAG: ABC transporter substrate-binding protein, partial [Acidobacteriota bacterium]
MNRKVIVSLALLLVLAVVVACAPAPTPVPPPAPTTAPAATAAPVATAAPAATAVPPTSAPAATAAPATKAPQPTTAPTVAAPPTNTPPATVMFGGTPIAGRTQVVWYVGLGAGGDPEVIPKEKAWVEKFNASQNEIQLILQVVHNPESYDTLKAQIAAGNPPDIVGPVGKAGRASFTGSWADISPLAQAANVDLTKYDPALLEFTKDEGVLVGIPFALFPSFLYYNKDLFDEAKLPYPPHKVGEKYQGKDWTLDTLDDLAQKLTV